MKIEENLIKELGKDFTGILTTLDNVKKLEIIPFGIHSLDHITGCGGIPRGRITEIYGVESAGKTSLCLSLVSSAQKIGIKVLYVDMEMALTKELALKMGVDLSRMIYAQPITGEEALALVEDSIEKGVGLVIVDSVSSLVPEDELEAEFNKDSIGLQARMMSKAMRKLIGLTKRKNAALIFINQIRSDIKKFGFGDKNTTSGGRALKFYSSLRLEVARTGWIAKNNEKIGLNIKVTTKKNKMSRPMLDTSFNFLFETGIDREEDLLNFMVAQGKVNKVGLTYYIGNQKLGLKEEAGKYLVDNPPVDK